MGWTLQEVLERALKKLKDSSFQRFIDKLSDWKVRKEYKNIQKSVLTGKNPETIAQLITENYRHAYGAEVTLAVLEDIDEKNLRQELQNDLRGVDVAGLGLGTMMFTDRVSFINNIGSDLITSLEEVDPVLRELQDQKLLTDEQYNDLRKKTTSNEKMGELCSLISHWEDSGKHAAYTAIKKYNTSAFKRLEEDWLRRNLQDKEHFISQHRSDLIKMKADVDPVLRDLRDQRLLSEEEYNKVMEKKTSQEKMTDLLDIIRHWDDIGMHTAYRVLRKYHKIIMRSLEVKDMVLINAWSHVWGDDHFVDRHRYHLIYNIKEVNAVLVDLQCNDLLTREQCKDVQKRTKPEEKMKLLSHIFRIQPDRLKDQFYISLWRYNYTVINNLEKSDKEAKSSESITSYKSAGGHFIDRHKEVLISKIKNVSLHSLYHKDLLTKGELEYIDQILNPKDLMRLLFGIIREWDEGEKEEVYQMLKRHNHGVFNDLKKMEKSSKLQETTGSQIMEKYEQYLIEKIVYVHPIINDLGHEVLLKSEDFGYGRIGLNSKVRMRLLYDVIRDWDDDGKDQVYKMFYKRNPRVIDDLKIKEKSSKFEKPSDFSVGPRRLLHSIPVAETQGGLSVWPHRLLHSIPVAKSQGGLSMWPRRLLNSIPVADSQGASSVSEHFVDRHRDALIKRTSLISPVLDDLMSQRLLTVEQYQTLRKMQSPQELLRQLYEYMRIWDDRDKETFYQALKIYNMPLIRELEIQDISKMEPHFSSELFMKTDTLKDGTHQKSKMSLSYCDISEDDMSCTLCNKSDNVITSSVISPTMKDRTYCLSMDSPGLFRCSESGIQFLVTQPVTVEYEMDSWSNYTEILQTIHEGYEIIGPLFNIKSAIKPNVVSAVYLPHCLCLGGFKGNNSLIKCFHYKDDNMTLETPSRLEAVYAVLENPTFSCFGVILSPLKKRRKICCHGMVLLFCNTIISENEKYMYRLHLYLLPRIRTAEKAVVNVERESSFQRIPKPPQTKIIYSKKNYIIMGPQNAIVDPPTLMFDSRPPNIYPYTEIKINGELDTEVDVSVLLEGNDDTVWRSVVSAEEMLILPSAISRLSIRSGDSGPPQHPNDHFLDYHRRDLILMINMVNPVLDELRSQELLICEQYSTVRSKSTTQEQMRQLYDYISYWSDDDKDKVYKALETHNPRIIKRLKRRVSAD